MSETSIDPNVWGPMMWDVLFYISFNVDLKKNCSDIHTLFHLLDVVLPCSHCRRSYALHKKQVPFVSTIVKSRNSSASEWLWTIHDMVNQELGKICISYEKLVKKHQSISCITSDMNIFDIIVFMWMSGKNKEKSAKAINIILKLLNDIKPFMVCTILNDVVSEHTTLETILEKKHILNEFYNEPVQTIDEMKKKYDLSIAI